MLSDQLGYLAGWALSPITGAIAFIRQSRMFHPEGILYLAEVISLNPLGAHLAGPAIIRMSTAWWKNHREWLDVLGCAIRFDPDHQPQDLLFATIRLPITLPFAPFTTKQHDYLANDYFAVSPFTRDNQGGYFKFKLTPAALPIKSETSRDVKFEQAVEDGTANFILQMKKISRPLSSWQPIANVRVLKKLDWDQEALRFSPFLAGKGIRPSGFIQLLRKKTYEASQRNRPAHS